MVQFHIFPGGKRRIVTFSYDDGHINDDRLTALFNRYAVKGSFHLNGNRYLQASPEELNLIRERYEGHEISCHTLRHGWPARMPSASLVGEIMEDRKILENLAGYPVQGMSYPSGSFSDDVEKTMAACGILYSRTTLSTKAFQLPSDFLAWHPTCHHRDALALAPSFMGSLDSEWTGPLFYIWGHAHELRTESDWEYIEAVVRAVAGSEKIWYATNMEIYSYFAALRQLRISADERIFYNPTAIDLWVERNKKDIIMIPAGKTVEVSL